MAESYGPRSGGIQMKDKRYRKFYLFSLAGIIAVSAYPIYMGILAVGEMLRNGAVPLERYPKYIIPYTPISIALIFGVLLLPLFQKPGKRLDFICGAVFSVGIFFIFERLMETKILVQTTDIVPLEGWQMSLCMVPPELYRTRTWEAVDVLLGGYSPAFKLHFYLISVILILSLLNSFYGFAKMIRSGDYTRKKILILQTISALAFLGMCIWACFTSFYRGGELAVSALSALLMSVFFALLGVTVGVFAGSFTLGKDKMAAVLLPALFSSLTTLLMYIGEMILLNGNLYRFGTGFLFDGLGRIVLAPVDLALILISGMITALLCTAVNGKRKA